MIFEGWKRVRLTSPGMASFVEEDLLRSAICSIALAFAWTGRGRGVLCGPVGNQHRRTQAEVDLFHHMTEGRDIGNPNYWCCGDAVGQFASLAGCRAEDFCNRDDDDNDGVKDTKEPSAEGRGTKDWRAAWNIILIQSGAKKYGAWVTPSSDDYGLRGDFFLIGVKENNPHVGTFVTDGETLSQDELPAALKGLTVVKYTTVEGGQLDVDGGQCVKVFTTYVVYTGQPYMTHDLAKVGRSLAGTVDVSKLPFTEAALVPADFEGGVPV